MNSAARSSMAWVASAAVMPVHLRSIHPTAKAWDAPRCTALRLPLGHGLWLQAADGRLIALEQAMAPLHRKEGEQQLLEVISAAV